MFQYAYGLAASKRIGAELKLDLSWFDANSEHRPYILNRFNIDTPIATQDEIEYIKTCNGKNFFEYRFNLLRNRFAPRHRKNVVKEDLSIYDEALKLPYKNSYIEGYFSTEQFFDDFFSEVRNAFQFTPSMDGNVADLASTINKSTIAFSIRRGDFLNNPLHNVCSKEYFYRALDLIKERVDEPELLIFSDDADWVMTNMEFDVPHRLVSEMDDYMNHMRLMSMCQNHIIPNSTFSWWGAWLSNPKIVLAPDLWLTDDSNIHQGIFGHWVETSHTVPEKWIRISARTAGDTPL